MAIEIFVTATPETATPLAALTGLQLLNLQNTPVSDVSPLAALTGLRIV